MGRWRGGLSRRVMTDKLETYSQAFDKFVAKTQVPMWVRQVQEMGFQRFHDLGFPQSKEEQWRFTNVAPIKESAVDWVDEQQALVSLSKAEQTFVSRFDKRLVFINGWFSEEHSQVASGTGIHAGLLIDEIKKDNARLKKTLRHYQHEDAFTSMNKAFTGQGAYLHINAKTSATEPVHILYINKEVPRSQGHEVAGCALVCPHNFIVLENFSEATILESYINFSGGAYFTNAVTDIFINEGAHLAHVKLQAESRDAFHVGLTRVHQERDSEFNSFSFALGSRIGRNNLDVTLAGEGASVSLDGLYALKGEQLVDNHTAIDHAVPHTVSRQLYKGILDESSHGVFNGRIAVKPGAQKTDSAQLNKNLILSRKAVIDTKPELEIGANDVTCTHGATVGQLSRDAIFYFESRGIPEETARKLLIRGFTAEVLERVTRDRIRNVLEALLKERYFSQAGDL